MRRVGTRLGSFDIGATPDDADALSGSSPPLLLWMLCPRGSRSLYKIAHICVPGERGCASRIGIGCKNSN